VTLAITPVLTHPNESDIIPYFPEILVNPPPPMEVKKL